MGEISNTIEKYKSNSCCFDVMKRVNLRYPHMRFFLDTSVLYSPNCKLGIFYVDTSAEDEDVQSILKSIVEEHPSMTKLLQNIYFTQLEGEPGIALPNLFEVTVET